MSDVFSPFVEFNDGMVGAWICGTSKRGYSPAWELLPLRSHNADSLHRIRPYGADVRVAPGHYFAARWENDWAVPMNVFYRRPDGEVEHVGSIARASDARGLVERHRGVPSTKSMPRLGWGFTTLPIGTAFVDTALSQAEVFRIASHGKARTQYRAIRWSDLVAGETLHVPHHVDWNEVLRARPNGVSENDPNRRDLRPDERALIPAGVVVLEYPERPERWA